MLLCLGSVDPPDLRRLDSDRRVMIFKDHALQHIIAALSAKNIELGKARDAYLSVKAEKDHFEATLVKQAPGDSNAEKVMNAKACEGWMLFHRKLGRLESEYEFYKLQFKVLELEYQAQYLSLKLDAGLIKRGE